MLTERQRQALDFIARYQREHRRGPSYAEIMEALGLKSTSGVHRIIHELRDRGFIRFTTHRRNARRAFELVRDADDCCPTCGRPLVARAAA